MDSTSFPKETEEQRLSSGQQPSLPAGTGKTLTPEELKMLPRLPTGLLLTVLGTLFFQALSSLTAQGLARDLWLHLPIQFYWTFCLFRLNKLLGRKYGGSPPLSDLEVAAISILSFVWMPTFDLYHFSSRFLDPMFIGWIATQLAWTARFGIFLERKEEPKQQIVWRIPVALTLGANAYLVAGIFYPIILSFPLFFNSLWFICQFWCIIFLMLKLQGKFDDRASTKSTADRSVAFAGSDVVIRYRAFAAIERWFQQRFSRQSMKTGAKFIFMFFVAPFLLIATLFLVQAIDPSGKAAGGAAAAAVAAGAAANVSFITIFLSSLAGISGLCTMLYLSKPTHIGFGRQGFRFLWRHKLCHLDGFYIPWTDISHISVIRPSKKTSPLDARLCFVGKGGKRAHIKMGSVDAVEDRETILNAIKKWAPAINRDASVEQALQPPTDYSYTELWLQALSAPPKRERLQPLIAGTLLKAGRYRVLQELGAGGQGQAYLAQDTQGAQEIVLKEFILPVYVDVNVRRGALEQFENEARILRQMDNPQIVKLVDFFIEDHRAYLVLEHINGASLREIVKTQGSLPEKQVRLLAVQMCEILGYLHGLSPPVVHRDFTPDNLILNTDGTLKLIDFNVAKQVVESTTAGTVVGKHAYLPPEQFRGMPETQSDIYAMGATLYFLLAGRDPVPIAVSHPARDCKEVSYGLNAIVERATAIDLFQRYQSVHELQADLSALPPES